MHIITKCWHPTAVLVFLLLCTSSIMAQSPAIIAPDFAFVNPKGETLSLSGMNKKFVYINFWASWCPTFSLIEPQLLRMEQDFGSRNFTNAEGFEIINISLDTSLVAWKQALEKYKGGVKNEIIATNGFNSAIAKSYGVTQLTTSYFIGPGNQVIGPNMKFTEIEQLLDSGVMVEETYFRVFLTVLPVSAEPFHNFSHVSHLGQLSKAPNNNGTTAYYLGIYYSRAEADRALSGAKDAGYQDAVVVSYKNSRLLPIDPRPSTPTPKDVGVLRSPGTASKTPPIFTPPEMNGNVLWANTPQTEAPPKVVSNSPTAPAIKYLLPPEYNQGSPTYYNGSDNLLNANRYANEDAQKIAIQLQQMQQDRLQLKATLQRLEDSEKKLMDWLMKQPLKNY